MRRPLCKPNPSSGNSTSTEYDEYNYYPIIYVDLLHNPQLTNLGRKVISEALSNCYYSVLLSALWSNFDDCLTTDQMPPYLSGKKPTTHDIL
jgi:hypothetical protein